MTLRPTLPLPVYCASLVVDEVEADWWTLTAAIPERDQPRAALLQTPWPLGVAAYVDLPRHRSGTGPWTAYRLRLQPADQDLLHAVAPALSTLAATFPDGSPWGDYRAALLVSSLRAVLPDAFLLALLTVVGDEARAAVEPFLPTGYFERLQLVGPLGLLVSVEDPTLFGRNLGT